MTAQAGTSVPVSQPLAKSTTADPQPRQTQTQKRAQATITDSTIAIWSQKHIWDVVRETVRVEVSHQEYMLKRIYNRQPRHVGHFLLRLIENISWIPRLIFEWQCTLFNVTIKFAVQCLDLAIVWNLRGLWQFPWAVTLFFALVAILPTIPYAMWVTEGHDHIPLLWTLAYISWFLRMSQLYISQPEKWLGYTRQDRFPYLTLDEFVKGPYLLLGLGLAVFAHFENRPVYTPFFRRY